MAQTYQALIARLTRAGGAAAGLCDLHDAFLDLKERAEDALRAAGPPPEVAPQAEADVCSFNRNFNDSDPSGVVCDPHIPVTNDLQSVKGNGLEEACTRRGARQEPQGCEGAAAPETKAARGEGGQTGPYIGPYVRPDIGVSAKAGAKAGSGAGAVTGARADEAGLSLRTILFACPTFAQTAHGLGAYIRDWREFVAAAERIRPMVGVSADAWEGARAALGPRQAAAALALIADKVADGMVSSPGGYLRGLTAKADRGDLHLARSVYGRLSERRRRG